MTTAATNVWTVARTDDRIVGVLLVGVGMMLLSLALRRRSGERSG